MYKLKPIFELNDVDIKARTTMYPMKNLLCTDSKSNVTIDEVVKLQETLMLKLDDLAHRLESYSCSSPKIETKMNPRELGITTEIVLFVNPATPLKSLTAINKFWAKSGLRINFICHRHSSIRGPLPNDVLEHENQLRSVSLKNGFTVRIIWKEVASDCSFLFSPIETITVMGEANFLRFLDKILSSNEDPFSRTIIDSKLDLAYSLSSGSKSKEDVQALFEGLNGTKFLCGDAPCVADLAAWSTVKRMKNLEIPPRAKVWLTLCDEMFKT